MSLFKRDLNTAPAAAAAVATGERARAVTRIAAGTRLEGVVSGATDLLIEGEIEGEVRVEGSVTVAPAGRVVGLIAARIVHVAGAIEGDVNGRERIELAPTARVAGDVAAPRVVIAEGAFLKGSVEMRQSADPEHPGPSGRA